MFQKTYLLSAATTALLFFAVCNANAQPADSQPKFIILKIAEHQQSSDGAWDKTKEIGSDIWDGTKEVSSDVWDGAKTVGKDVWNGAKEVGSDVKDGLSGDQPQDTVPNHNHKNNFKGENQ